MNQQISFKNSGSFTDHFNASTDEHSYVTYYKLKSSSAAINKDAKLWVARGDLGDLYFFPPYFTPSQDNLNNTNHTKISAPAKSRWLVLTNQKLPSNVKKLTDTDSRYFWRNGIDFVPDLGPYDYEAASRYFLDFSVFGLEGLNFDGVNISHNGGVYFKQSYFIISPKESLKFGL